MLPPGMGPVAPEGLGPIANPPPLGMGPMPPEPPAFNVDTRKSPSLALQRAQLPENTASIEANDVLLPLLAWAHVSISQQAV